MPTAAMAKSYFPTIVSPAGLNLKGHEPLLREAFRYLIKSHAGHSSTARRCWFKLFDPHDRYP